MLDRETAEEESSAKVLQSDCASPRGSPSSQKLYQVGPPTQNRAVQLPNAAPEEIFLIHFRSCFECGHDDKLRQYGVGLSCDLGRLG